MRDRRQTRLLRRSGWKVVRIWQHQLTREQIRASRLYEVGVRGMIRHMSTITAILEPDADGTVHLPLPLDLRYSRVRVTATLEADVRQSDEHPLREAAMAALKRLRARGTFLEISDPVAWQREIRKDRPLPGREE